MEEKNPPELETREGRAKEFGALLSTHLQRLGDLRATMPPEERQRELPVLYVVPKTEPAAPREPLPPRILCTPEQIIRELVILDIVFPSQQMTPEERSFRYQIYCRDLADLTEQELVELCQAYRKNTSARFFPTPGQILNEMPLDQRIIKNI